MLLVVKFRKQRKDNHSLVCIVDKVTSFFGLPQQFLITFSYNSEALSGSLAGKESACNAGDPGSILVSGRSSGEGIGYPLQYSWASLVAQMVKNLPAMQEIWLDLWVGKIPWRRAGQPTPVFLPGEFPWTEEPSRLVHGVAKSQI